MSRLLAGLEDSVQQFGGGVIGRKHLLGQAGVADHADQQVVEVVRDAAGQQAEALQLLRLPEALLGALEFRDIGEDTHPASRTSLFVQQRHRIAQHVQGDAVLEHHINRVVPDRLPRGRRLLQR